MKCRLCGSKKFKKLYVVEQFKIEKCTNCGLVRTNSLDTKQYDEYHRDEKEYTKDEALFRNIFLKRYQNIIKYKDKETILDIGASTGTMLSIFKDAGWDVWGVEPSETAVKVAKKRGIKMSQGFFENVKLPPNHFDVVLMNHTFEHVEDPLKVLKKIKRVLKKDGIVYIDVPNFDSWDAQVKGANWGYLMPSEHTFHYTSETLRKLMEKTGFEVVWWGSWSGIFDVGNPIKKLWYELSHFKLAFFKDLVRIPVNIFTTATKRGASLAMIGRKG